MYKVIDMDISDSVFDNDISAFMYIIKDIYTDGYINAIPSILFFVFHYKRQWLQIFVGIGYNGEIKVIELKKKIVNEIKKGINKIEEEWFVNGKIIQR